MKSCHPLRNPRHGPKAPVRHSGRSAHGPGRSHPHCLSQCAGAYAGSWAGPGAAVDFSWPCSAASLAPSGIPPGPRSRPLAKLSGGFAHSRPSVATRSARVPALRAPGTHDGHGEHRAGRDACRRWVAARRRRATESWRWSGLSDRAQHRTHQMSGGERQRAYHGLGPGQRTGARRWPIPPRATSMMRRPPPLPICSPSFRSSTV